MCTDLKSKNQRNILMFDHPKIIHITSFIWIINNHKLGDHIINCAAQQQQQQRHFEQTTHAHWDHCDCAHGGGDDDDDGDWYNIFPYIHTTTIQLVAFIHREDSSVHRTQAVWKLHRNSHHHRTSNAAFLLCVRINAKHC